jgi:steroid Delta-isomerase
MDLTAWLATFDPDAVSYEPGNPPLQGQEALRRFFAQFTSLFQTVGLQEEFISVVGNRAAAKWVGQGVGKNGRPVTFEGIDLFEISDRGQIQTLHGYWNPEPLMAELLGAN